MRLTHYSGGRLAKVVIVTWATNPFAWVVVNLHLQSSTDADQVRWFYCNDCGHTGRLQ